MGSLTIDRPAGTRSERYDAIVTWETDSTRRGPGVEPLGEHDLLDGRYRIGAVLGAGGMAEVREAYDTRLRRRVAVKLLRASSQTEPKRLLGEIRALASLEHPNIVRLLDAGGTAGGRPYLVIELVEGVTLASVLAQGPLGEQDVGALAAAVAGGLAYVHARGIVHRDVKPANILLGPDDRIRIADFGVARLVDTGGLTLEGVVLGTPAYLAPEQVRGARVGPPADVYALGLVLAECLTGERVFDGPPGEVTAARLQPLPLALDGVPTPWRSLLAAMTSATPEDRPAASEVARRARACSGGAGASVGAWTNRPPRVHGGHTAGGPSAPAAAADETVADTVVATCPDGTRATVDPPGRRGLAARRRALAAAVVVALCGIGGAVVFGGRGGSGSGTAPTAGAASNGRTASGSSPRTRATGGSPASATSSTATSTATSTTTSTTSTTVPATTSTPPSGRPARTQAAAEVPARRTPRAAVNALVGGLRAGVAAGTVTRTAATELVGALETVVRGAGEGPAALGRAYAGLEATLGRLEGGGVTGPSTGGLKAAVAGLGSALGIDAATAGSSPPAASPP